MIRIGFSVCFLLELPHAPAFIQCAAGRLFYRLLSVNCFCLPDNQEVTGSLLTGATHELKCFTTSHSVFLLNKMNVTENAAACDAITVHNFSEKILEQVIHFHVMKLSGGFFLWIGSSPVLSSLAVSMNSKYVSKVVNVR